VRFLASISCVIRARLAGPLLRKGEAVNKSETVIKLARHANRILTFRCGLRAAKSHYTRHVSGRQALLAQRAHKQFLCSRQ
jgi:hypothetical protein